jgi:hypothetical protein
MVSFHRPSVLSEQHPAAATGSARIARRPSGAAPIKQLRPKEE